MTNANLSNHRPENLLVIDDLLDESFREAMSHRKDGEGAPILFGSYLGEVLVQNLAARWHFPSWVQAVRAYMPFDHLKAERYWYVELGDERIYVYRAAREAIEKTGAVFSLFEFYQRYARRKMSPLWGSD